MAEFSGRIITARYISENYDTIEIVYRNGADRPLTYIVPNNPKDKNYQALVADGWTKRKLTQGTMDYKKNASRGIGLLVEKRFIEAKNELRRQQDHLSYKNENFEKEIESKEKNLDGTLWNTIIHKHADEEELFKFKLWALEQKYVKESNSSIKSKLKKCNSIIEGLNIVHGLSTSIKS